MKKENLILDKLLDKQDLLNNVTGFLAPTNRELSEALAIVGTRDTVGTEQHLHEIYRRQLRNRTQKPENAVIAVTREYITAYRSSHAIARHLGYLAVDINHICNPNIYLSEEYESVRQGHRALVRFDDLNRAMIHNNESELKATMSRHYFSKDSNTTDYVSERLGEIKVKDARSLVRKSLIDQKNRTVFWRETISSLSAHRIAGPIVRNVLSLEK